MSKHAYLIMTHGQFDQLKKLILLLDDPRNDIYVHVDAKSHDFNQDQFNNLTKKAGLFFIKRKRVTWGAFSQVNCELRLLKTATKTYHNFYHLLSGADLPIKSQDEIHNYFEENSETEFLSIHEGVMETKNYRDRIQVYHFLQGLVGNKKSDSIVFKIEWGLLKLQELLNVDRLKKTNLVFQKGTNWFSITHKLAQYVVSEAPQIRKIYKLTKCADEVFLHTLAWNSQFRDRIQSDSKRLIDWKRGRPYTFRLNDFEALMNSPCFWARKFNEAVEPEIVNKLFQTLNLNS